MKKKYVWAGILSIALAIGTFAGTKLGMVNQGQVVKAEGETVEAPTFSVESGSYTANQTLILAAESGTTIYYTTNGDKPSATKGTKYSGTITVKNRSGEENQIATAENSAKTQDNGTTTYVPTKDQVDKATVIRAIAIRDADSVESPIVTKTYFVGNNISEKYKGTAVMSLVIDNDDLYGDENGIYCKGSIWQQNLELNNQLVAAGQYYNCIGNYTQKKWERAAHMDFFEGDGTLGTSEEMGARIHGGASRMYAQKSFNFYFKSAYGNKTLEYNLFPGEKNGDGTKEVTSFGKFMIRNGGNDTEYTKVGDVFTQSLIRDRNYATQAYRPCVVYLNGEYWGLYNLQEKYSDDYIASEYDVAKKNVIAIKDGEIDEGEDTDQVYYDEFLAFGDKDMTQASNYEDFCSKVDIQSYIDYYATEILIGNKDWPEKNYEFWRTRTAEEGNPYGDTKWRWMIFDTEFGMGLYGTTTGDNAIAWATRDIDGECADPVFKAVSANADFQKQFTNTICDIMNVNFETNHATEVLNGFSTTYAPLMEQYRARFGATWNPFNQNIQRMQTFVGGRSTVIMNSVKTSMAAGMPVALTLKNSKASTMAINTTKAPLTNGSWTGKYTRNYPVTVTAPKVDGFDFAGWKVSGATVDDTKAETAQVTFTSSAATVEATYEVAKVTEPTPSPTVPTASPSATPTVSPSTEPQDNDTLAIVTVGKASIKKVTASRKKLNVIWKKVNGVKGYQIQVSLNNKFTKGKKTSTVSTTKKAISGLKAKKKYYVRVRAYKVSDGKKVYGKWSKVVTKKTK